MMKVSILIFYNNHERVESIHDNHHKNNPTVSRYFFSKHFKKTF